jgi:hypothetical protein
MCHVWLYWAGGKLKRRVTAAVGKSNTKDGLKAVIGPISVELWKYRMWKLLTEYL